MFDALYLDDDRSWRGRTIKVRPNHWYAEVTLDRDNYVLTTEDRGEDAELPEAFLDAARRYNESANKRIGYDGYPGTFLDIRGKHGITLYTPFSQTAAVRDALRTAELDRDYRALHELVEQLALPVDRWLDPGERQLLRGVDFSPPPEVFLRFLRSEAAEQGLRLNGRAEIASVWVRPTVKPFQKRLREAHPERFPGWTDRWSGHQLDDEAPRRPWVGGRQEDLSAGAMPVAFLPATVRDSNRCPCGSPRMSLGDEDAHHRHHANWAYGILVPKNLLWVDDLAVVTSQSSISWRRLADRTARLPQRERRYDFSSWSHTGKSAETPGRDRAYLLQADEHVVGFLAAHDVDRHRWWDLEDSSECGEPVEVRRPRIDMIWTADTYRRHGIGQALVQALAADYGCAVTDVSWSAPVTSLGQTLARRLSPRGIWIS